MQQVNAAFIHQKLCIHTVLFDHDTFLTISDTIQPFVPIKAKRPHLTVGAFQSQ